jgi:hypothetical protein
MLLQYSTLLENGAIDGHRQAEHSEVKFYYVRFQVPSIKNVHFNMKRACSMLTGLLPSIIREKQRYSKTKNRRIRKRREHMNVALFALVTTKGGRNSRLIMIVLFVLTV